ncbi:MAG TPA: hypothetical protein DCW83_14855 [Saprospirales bacterium]|jgi:hypothetical protein|nr:hypothetical protein [Saprospirales bacterium]
MNIKVTDIVEMADGSTLLELDVEAGVIDLLVQIGIEKILGDYLVQKQLAEDAKRVQEGLAETKGVWD